MNPLFSTGKKHMQQERTCIFNVNLGSAALQSTKSDEVGN